MSEKRACFALLGKWNTIVGALRTQRVGLWRIPPSGGSPRSASGVLVPTSGTVSVYDIWSWLATALAIPWSVLMIYDRKAVTVFVVAVHLIYPSMYYVRLLRT